MITGLSGHNLYPKNKNVPYSPHLSLKRCATGPMSVPSTKDVDHRRQAATSCNNVKSNSPLRSVSHLFAAVAIGLVNGMLFVAFIMPFAGAWLAWKQPYVVLPAAVAYYFLRWVGTLAVHCVLQTEYALLPRRLLYRISMTFSCSSCWCVQLPRTRSAYSCAD